MHRLTRIPVSLVATLSIALACMGGAPALASQASAFIQTVYPSGGASAGQTFSFYTAASGFTDPTYSISDDYSGSSVSAKNMEASGYFSWVPTIDDAGTHHITVNVTDLYGNSASATATLYVIPNSISIQNLSPGTTVYAHEPVTFTIHSPGFTNPTFTVFDTYAGSSFSTSAIAADGTVSWTPATNEQGLHTITLIVSDNFGRSANTRLNLTVVPPSAAILGAPANGYTQAGTHLTLTASTTGLVNPTFSVADSLGWYSTLGSSNFSTSTAGQILWTPLAGDIGVHTITLTATDANGGTASAKTVITVGSAPATSAAATSSVQTSAPSNTTSTTSGYTFTKYLNIGSSGTEVTELQKYLTAAGLYTGPITGYFGSLSFAGVKRFQAAHGIAQVGFVGPQTRAALNTK